MKRIVLLLVLALVACAPTPQPPTTVVQPSIYGPCPAPQDVCKSHTVTGGCLGEACFKINGGRDIDMVAQGVLGDFPDTWIAATTKGKGALTKPDSTDGISFPCDVTPAAIMTEIHIPSGFCAAKLETPGHIYFEHIASNPSSRCLGWVECQVK